MTEEIFTAEIRSMWSYALFVNNEFVTVYHYPSEGSEEFLMMTAALQSNPTIVPDNLENDKLSEYKVYVEDEFAGKIYILNEMAEDLIELNQWYFDLLRFAFDNNPTVVWIDSDIMVPRTNIYSYDGTTLTLVQE